jgi:hypothetical protein
MAVISTPRLDLISSRIDRSTALRLGEQPDNSRVMRHAGAISGARRGTAKLR